VTRIGRGVIAAALSVAVLPAAASASTAALAAVVPPTPTVSIPARTPAPKPKLKPKPAKGQLLVALAGIFHVNGRPVTITNRAVRVNGYVRPFVAGQTVTVRASVGPRLIHSERVRVIRSRGGTYGHFSVRFASSQVGQVSISAVHNSNTKLERLVASSSLAALAPSAGFGSNGRFVQLIQGRLQLLHFYIPQTGVYDTGTGWAIDAYHRLRGWGTSQNLDRATIAGLLDEAGSFHIRYPGEGKHAEGNLSVQLLALAYGGRVYRIYPISSGKPSTPTVLGHFNVYLKDPYYLPDGMYFSSFFYGGYAIHGFDPAPDYPASHGCMRVPIPDAVSIYNWLDFGNGVDVYY
jgi:hypothetical protein